MLDGLRSIRTLDERVVGLGPSSVTSDQDIRGARHALEGARSEVGAVEVARARAVADLTHLGCLPQSIGVARRGRGGRL